MDDEEKIYWMKIILGIVCGMFSLIVIPQSWVNSGIRVGWLRLLWLLGTWLLLPFPLVLLGMKFGWLGVTKKDKEKIKKMKEDGQTLPKFKIKAALKKIGGGKFILKTGVGAFFFLFMLSSTLFFTIISAG
ncbi:MAG: hypothetical protein ACTSYF_14320 [Promethearchaeota archaeon]